MKKISFKERIFFGLVCNEQRVYHHWYSRFLLAQVDIDRIRRVVKRIRNWFHWLDEVIPKTIDWLLKQFNMKHPKLN